MVWRAVFLRLWVHNGAMVSADIVDVKNLDISAREIINQIPKGKGDWQDLVPEKTAKGIIKNKLFGYPDK